jgi:hypothetical protein
MGSPIQNGAKGMGDTTVKTGSTSASTVKSGSNKAPNITSLASGYTGQSGATGGAVFTPAEGDYVVQTVYQQLLGRNAGGNDYAKAYSIAMNQSNDSSIYARQQAVTNAIMASPEYQAREDNKYLDAIYNAIAADVRKVRQ